MEMEDGNRRLIRDRETMDEDCCCCCCRRGGDKTGAPGPEPSIRAAVQRMERLQRAVQLAAVALLLLASAALALLFVAVRGQRSADMQPSEQYNSQSPGMVLKHQRNEDFWYPIAMLTVPFDTSTGEFLAWESNIGNTFLHGGFNYTNGSLVVPRGGIYRVFLQITYESKKGHMPCDVNDTHLKLNSTVFYFHDNYRRNTPLLSLFDIENCSLVTWRKSLYTAGLFLLQATGKLRVTSSHPGLIAGNEHEVFFGAEYLPQQFGQTAGNT